MDNKLIAKVCVHCYIIGRVQGVGFRYYTKKRAIQYAIKGWVRNLPDGRVEVLACGLQNNLKQFMSFLRQGPINAKVDEVITTEQLWQEFQEFSII